MWRVPRPEQQTAIGPEQNVHPKHDNATVNVPVQMLQKCSEIRVVKRTVSSVFRTGIRLARKVPCQRSCEVA
jgi:hypothetical protein